MSLSIRVAHPSDSGGVHAIYAPIVEETPISFELAAPPPEEIEHRIRGVLPTHPWLVGEDEDGTIAGYAYAGRFRSRRAYRWSTEVSAYVHPEYRGRGIATALYTGLFGVLRAQSFARLLAGITLPNDASVRLHEALGFEPLGVYDRVGYKFGAWHDVGWWQRSLPDVPNPPKEPVEFRRLAGSEEVAGILREAAATIRGK